MVGGHAGILAAHDAGDDDRFGRVGDDEHRGGEKALLAVERDQLFARGGASNDKGGAAELAGIKGVHGLAVLEHHVIADIDHIVDRAQADGGEALLHPVGAGPNLDARDHGGGVKRAVLGGIDADRREQIGTCGGRCGGRGEANLGVGELFLEPGGELAGEAEVGLAVRAVGCDLDVVGDIAGGQDGVDGRAELGAAREQEQAGGVLGHTDFLGGAHHAIGELAADLGLLDDEIAGQHGVGEGDGDAVTDLVVLGPADDCLGAMHGTDID